MGEDGMIEATPLSAEIVDVLMRSSAASVSSVLFKMGLRDQWMRGVRPTGPIRKLAGPAFTLRYMPAREDLDVVDIFRDPDHPQRRAIETAPPGHVLVMDCRGDASGASCGSVLVHRLAKRGVAGLVSDGGLRDAEEAVRFGLPCYTGGPCAPTNIARHHAVDLDVPIGCGGVAVYPGDLVVADGDGVVVVPRHLADEVAAQASPMRDYEAYVHAEIDRGSALAGLYPLDADGQVRYAAWQARNRF